jgi:hypothetical protein
METKTLEKALAIVSNKTDELHVTVEELRELVKKELREQKAAAKQATA